ncbi:MAG TPA: type II secretion system F family protein [Hydrogenophaga sp.]|uniref:type II secretion system F family protein n=1 Tax=Hydrogenophaga sp. TaxID=1904254 RepID=UPI002C81C6DD|nr:type II secretion system F family protein [Hydrogenophaga sp.]HMN91724.1 type II secretion system F family protein [Hydrogenophaga sp.]HMP10558.1 type II secretion system F family protein [Hydrogenophaga sp.]
MQEQTTLIISLLAATIGLSVALIVWLFSRAVSEVPPEDRQYKDPPPLGFRLMWWPVRWLSHFIEPLYRGKRHHAALLQLRKAGLDYSLTPAQFSASRWVCGAVVAGVFAWVLGSFDSARHAAQGLGAGAYMQAALAGFVLGFFYPVIWLKDRVAARRAELMKTLPFFLDIITLCVEAGLNLQGAINQAVAKGPKGVLRDEFQRVLRDVRAGKSRADSLRAMSERLNEGSITNFVSAVVQAESMGMNLGPVLRAQADQRRSERFLRAEKLAMEAPVKMLFPLIAFIFPCTFIVLFFPIVMKFMQSGL